MTLRQLQYVVAVADTKNFRLAAERCRVSQPSLSAQVAELEGAPPKEHLLGPNVLAGARPQVVVPAHAWQSAWSLGDWTLVGCTVAPAFQFEGFELAPEGWEPDQKSGIR